MQVVGRSSLVSVLFREAFSHPYVSFFYLLVNGFSVTCNLYRLVMTGKAIQGYNIPSEADSIGPTKRKQAEDGIFPCIARLKELQLIIMFFSSSLQAIMSRLYKKIITPN